MCGAAAALGGGRDPPRISGVLAGDMNCGRFSGRSVRDEMAGAYQLMTSGALPSSHPQHPAAHVDERDYLGNRMSLLPSSVPDLRMPLAFASAYAAPGLYDAPWPHCDAPWTALSPVGKGVDLRVDYVFLAATVTGAAPVAEVQRAAAQFHTGLRNGMRYSEVLPASARRAANAFASSPGCIPRRKANLQQVAARAIAAAADGAPLAAPAPHVPRTQQPPWFCPLRVTGGLLTPDQADILAAVNAELAAAGQPAWSSGGGSKPPAPSGSMPSDHVALVVGLQ